MIHRRLVVALVLSLVVAPVARADSIDDYIRAQMKAFNLPGLSIAIVENGKITRSGAYGLSDRTRDTPATPETVYKIASVSKQFIATAIMLLVQDGRLSVDDPVSKHIKGTPGLWQPITIRHLLTHTSGLVRESPGFDLMKIRSDADVIKAAYAVPLRFAPGAKWEYCNTGYFVLAEIVTRVSGRPWPEFIQERVFTPAGMTVTATTNAAPARLATGYGGKDNRQRADEWVAVRPSGAFVSTVGDLAKWDALLYTDRILTEASRSRMWAPVGLADGSTYPYGFGWHLETRKDGRHVVWHGGGLPGFASYFGRFIDDRVGVIVLTNGNDVDVIALANGLADVYLKLAQGVPRLIVAPHRFRLTPPAALGLDQRARHAERE